MVTASQLPPLQLASQTAGRSSGREKYWLPDLTPVSARAFAGAKEAIDLIYYPAQSEFLRLAKECGLKTLNGAAMLFYQGYYSDCLYLGLTPNEAQAVELYKKYEEKKKESGL